MMRFTWILRRGTTAVPLGFVLLLLLLDEIGTTAAVSQRSPPPPPRRSSSLRNHVEHPIVWELSLQPCDVVWDSVVRAALDVLRQSSADSSHAPQQQQHLDALTVSSLQSCYHPGTKNWPTSSRNNNNNQNDSRRHRVSSRSALALTLVGFKGGSMIDQVNQDRAFVWKFSSTPLEPANNSSNRRSTRIQNSSSSSSLHGSEQSATSITSTTTTTISGVMDGHGTAGHGVSEWSRHELLKRLSVSSSVSPWLGDSQNETSDKDDTDDDEESVIQMVKTVLLEMDRDLPEALALQGGATASFVLCRQKTSTTADRHTGDTAAAAPVATDPIADNNKDDDKLYFVNLGDSQSFVVAAIVSHSSSNTTDTTISNNNNPSSSPMLPRIDSDSSLLLHVQVVFSTKGHKPDDPEERARLEALGMRVTAESDETGEPARVWYRHRTSASSATPSTSGLAMSRALGDRQAVGVIADPTIDVWKISDAVNHVLETFRNKDKDSLPKQRACAEMNADGSVVNDSLCTKDTNAGTDSDSNPSLATAAKITKENVRLFVVSATDGVMDYLSLDDIANSLAEALYEVQSPNKKKIHVLTAAEALIHQASAQWQNEFNGQYRDDMAITMAQVH